MKRLLVIGTLLLVPASVSAHDGERYRLPAVIGNRDAADPWQPVPRTTYQSVTAATKSYRPVDPLPWGELNRRVTPHPKGESKVVPGAPHKHP